MRSVVLPLIIAGFLFVTVLSAQQPVLQLTATSVNVSEPGNTVRIDINRWSTNQERDQLLIAMNPPPPEPPSVDPVTTAPRGGEGAAGTRGGARGGARGAAGARGGGRGRGATEAPRDPISNLTAAIGRAPTLGYIWTNEVVGYAIKYAWSAPSPDGGERIILATNRRIGAHTLSWTPVGAPPTAYEFTIVEIRLPRGGSGEAKTSLNTSIAIDSEARTVALENYSAAPPLLTRVSHR